jgi:hypothetical protein
MTNSRKTLFLGLLFICTLVLSNSVVAQDTVDEARVMFVEIEDLDPYSYKDIVEGLESSKGFAVMQACVPAGILMLSITDVNVHTLDDNFSTFKKVVLQSTDLEKIKIIAEYSEDDFNTRCNKFRMRKPE